VLFFQVFTLGSEQLVSRVWLLDPVHAQVDAASTPPDGPKEEWNGEYYCSFGHGEARSWADAVTFGFVCGGGGAWYSRTLQLLAPGDRIWVKVPSAGFVGVGQVTGRAQPLASFTVETPRGEVAVSEVARAGHYHRELSSDSERCEYFVPVHWLQTTPLEDAVQEVGFFGNQNTVCRPTTAKWRSTVERLKQRFPDFDKSASPARDIPERAPASCGG
jgi:hypothetical protein